MKEPAITTGKAMRFMILFMIFLGALDFAARYYVWFFAAFIIFFIYVGRGKLAVDRSFVALLFFAMFVVLFSPDTFLKYTYILKPFVYPLCYLVGYNLLGSRDHASDEKTIKKLWFIIFLAMMVHWALNMSANQSINNRLELIDYWTREETSATLMATIATVPVGISCAMLIASPKKWQKLLAAVALIVILLFNLSLGGRSVLLITAICLVAGFLFFLKSSRNAKTKIRTSVIALVVVAACVVIYTENHFGVRDVIEDSIFNDRFYGQHSDINIDDDDRLQTKWLYLENMVFYPFGGDKLRESLNWNSAHDLYLDTYSYSGALSFIALMYFIIASIIRVCKLIKDRGVSLYMRTLFFCAYLAMHIQFLIEPIIRGMPWLLAVYCLMDGLLASYLTRNKRRGKDCGELADQKG